MAEKTSLGKELTKGFVRENPVLRLVLGTCPTLAVTSSMVSALGMGIAVIIVLICSNSAVSALRKVIPSKVRLPAYVVIIASFVSLIQMLIKAYVPALNDALGVYLPLIVVNCIIFGRAEAFAGSNPVIASAIDGLGMGIGFTAALFLMSTIREFFGNGTLLYGLQGLVGFLGDNVLGGFDGIDLAQYLPGSLAPITIFVLPAGGFFVFGILIAVANRIAREKRLPDAVLHGCESCPMVNNCARTSLNKDKGGETA